MEVQVTSVGHSTISIIFRQTFVSLLWNMTTINFLRWSLPIVNHKCYIASFFTLNLHFSVIMMNDSSSLPFSVFINLLLHQKCSLFLKKSISSCVGYLQPWIHPLNAWPHIYFIYLHKHDLFAKLQDFLLYWCN